MDTKNGKIRKAELGYEGHGILTVMLDFEWENGVGSGLPLWNMNSGPFLAACIKGILDTLGVDSWSKVVGQYVRIRFTDGGGVPIIGFGHIVEDRWFIPGVIAAQFKED